MNVHNLLTTLSYAPENGSVLELQNRQRYIVCKYDQETRDELLQTSANTKNLNIWGMMAIRNELTPQMICQFYPADLPRTWYIAFFRVEKRQIDSFSYPISANNVPVMLDRFRKKGLGEDLDGAFWYSKPSDGYFTSNPQDTGEEGVPSLTDFLADAQPGWALYGVPAQGVWWMLPGSLNPNYTQFSTLPLATQKIMVLPGYSPSGMPAKQLSKPASIKPNKLGRQIDLEEE